MSRYLYLILFMASTKTSGEAPSECYNPIGTSVSTINAIFSPQAAMATQRPDGQVAIMINSNLMKKFSPKMQRWAYWHECGHIGLGHLLGTVTVLQEQQADCFAIRAAITLGEIKLSDVDDLQKEIIKLGPGDWQHLSGAKRAINIRKCLNDGTNEKAWSACKQKYYANLNQIEQAAPVFIKMKKICDQFSSVSSECQQAKSLAKTLDDGFIKVIDALDQECPYVIDPRFSLIWSQYQKSKLQLLRPTN